MKGVRPLLILPFVSSVSLHLTAFVAVVSILGQEPLQLYASRSYPVSLVSPAEVQIAESSRKSSPITALDRKTSKVKGAAPAPPAVRASSGTQSTGQRAGAGVLEESATIRDVYIGELMRWIESYKQYPVVSRRMGEQGTAEVEFVLSKDGMVSAARLSRSAGYFRLDEAALSLISGLGHFKAIPEELKINEWKLVLPIAYALNP